MIMLTYDTAEISLNDMLNRWNTNLSINKRLRLLQAAGLALIQMAADQRYTWWFHGDLTMVNNG